MAHPAAAHTDAHITIENVHMAFGERVVFDDLSCAFPRGKITVVFGGSGSGKSTVLRMIGALVHPSSGRITVDDDEVTAMSETEIYAVRNNVGMMFQGGALLDSMSVFDNLAFPLREHTRMPESEIADRVHARLAAVGLTDVDELLPGQLSGGMVKRVALARASIRDPRVLLIDEPFSGLDPVSTKLIEALLIRANREQDVTMVVVSHHVQSTLRMADWIVLLMPGRVVAGTPEDLCNSEDPNVSRFFDEHVADSGEVLQRLADYESEGGGRPGGPR